MSDKARLCACGCGLPAPPDRYTRVYRFRHGHNRPVTGFQVAETKGYRHVTVNGKQRQWHRVRAEAALGHPLPVGAEVHHADGSTGDNAPLVICQNRAYHELLHVRMRIVRMGGNPNTERICGVCGLKPIADFPVLRRVGSGVRAFCRRCTNIKQNERRARVA